MVRARVCVCVCVCVLADIFLTSRINSVRESFLHRFFFFCGDHNAAVEDHVDAWSMAFTRESDLTLWKDLSIENVGTVVRVRVLHRWTS